MEPWINISLLPPPVQTVPMKGYIDILGLKHACENIIRVLSKQSPLHGEGALLSRFIYKYDKKFRNDIGYRNIRKTYLSMQKYMKINLLKDVENFSAVLPSEDDDFVPTRQMLEYVMSRIITFSKLMVRIYVCSKQAAVFYMDRVKRGESHWMSLMPYALLSRIWSICGVLLHHSTSWYSCLYPYLGLLQPKGLQFLPQGHELPQELSEWLDIQNLDTFGKINWSDKKSVDIGIILEDDTDSFDNFLKYANNINSKNLEVGIEETSIVQDFKVDNTIKTLPLFSNNITKSDCGEVVSRESFNALNSKQQEYNQSTTLKYQEITEKSCKILTNFQKKITDGKSNHYFGKVTNVKTLKDFLDKEESFRNDGNIQSLTKHLSFMQWHTLKTSLLKIGDTVLNDKKIERKLYKVWKEKCLEYT